MAYENLDRRLVNSLLEDGRASMQKLGEELGVSVTTISYHLDDLEKAGIISGYEPVVNYDKMGFDVTAIFHLSVSGDLATAVEQLRSHGRLTAVYETTGDFDIIAIGKFTDTDAMNDEIKTILGYSGIEESDTSVALSADENRTLKLDTDQTAAPIVE